MLSALNRLTGAQLLFIDPKLRQTKLIEMKTREFLTFVGLLLLKRHVGLTNICLYKGQTNIADQSL